MKGLLRFKGLLLVALALFALLLLSSCKRDYEPVESTEEEKRVVMTLEFGGEKYEVRYELYYMLFMNNHQAVDGGDNSVWSGTDSEAYVDRMNEVILNRSAEIFSVIHHAKNLGIDPYSKEIEEDIYELVRIGVEGNGDNVQGHGTYEKYLASLKEKNMNYAVQELLFRYSILLTRLSEYYGGVEDAALGRLPGEFEVTRENVKAYYDSDECRRVLYVYFQDGVRSLEQMEGYRAKIAEKNDPAEVALYMINLFSPVPDSVLIDRDTKGVSGTVIGRNELDGAIWGKYTDSVFSLAPGQTGEVITVTDDRTYYYIAYGVEKSDEHFDAFYEDVKASYIENEIGKALGSIADSLRESARFTDGYESVDHSGALTGK